MTTTTFTVYTLTPKGSFSLRYEGTDEQEAQAAFNKLEAKNAPRALFQKSGPMAQRMQIGGGFPQ